MSKLADTLVAARQFKAVSLGQVEQATRIRRAYLEALEADRFSDLPAPVYTRGFVRNYASYLGLDPEQVVRLYEEAIGYRPQPVRIETPGTVRVARLMAPNVAAISIAVIVAAILFVWLYSALFVEGPIRLARVPTPPPATPTALAGALPTPTHTPAPASPTPTIERAATVLAAGTPPSTPVPARSATARAAGTVAPTTVAGVTPSPTSQVGPLSLKIRIVDAPSWVQIRSDGVVVFTGTLPVGSERTFNASSEIFIHAGRSDAVDVILNGVPQGRLGNPGQSVVRRTFTTT